VYGSCVSVTITLDEEAYQKLKAAKRGRESFSSVVKRAVLPSVGVSGKDVIDYYRDPANQMSEEQLDSIEESLDERRKDLPSSPWDE